MKKVLLTFLVAGVALAYSCNSTDKNEKSKAEKETVAEKDAAIKNASEANVDEQAAAEMCNCFNRALSSMNPNVKSIIVKAGHSDDPITTLQTDLQKLAGTEEQQQIAQEFQHFENDPQLQQCADQIKKKYNLDDKDKKAQEKILKAAEKNGDCEVVYALMKIGLQQEERAKGSGAGAAE
jgi:hypothetical protein